MAESHILRIKSNLRSVSNELTDLFTGLQPKIYSGADVSIQVGVFEDSAVVDVSNFSSVIVEIKNLSAGSAPAPGQGYLVQKTIETFDNTLNTTSWGDNSKQHFTISLSDVDTGGLKEGIKFISAYAVTSSGNKLTLFAGKLQIVEDGISAGAILETEITQLTTKGDLITHDGTSAVRLPVGTNGQFLKADSTAEEGLAWGTPSGSGDVLGDESGATDMSIARFNGTSGQAIEDSTATIDDSGNLSIAGNITVTGTVDGRDLATDGTKLDGIESSATADQTGAEIKALYEAEADTNAFTDALASKLAGIESNATADQTGSEIKALYEAEADTNAFDDAAVSKLAGIEANADVTDTTNVVSALSVTGLTSGSIDSADKVLIQDVNDSHNLKVVTAQNIADLASSDVTSVNSLTGAVVLDPDDLDDTSTTNKFTSASDISKLAGIEASADVTDAANVTSSLSGATITAATVASTDKILIQDVDDSDNLKTVTAQSIADLASSGSGGDLVRISTTTIGSSVSAVDISGLDTSGYGSYLLLLEGISIATDDDILNFSLSTDGGSNFNVPLTGAHRTMGAGTVSNTVSALSSMNITANATVTMSNAANAVSCGALHIFGADGTSNWKGFQYSGSFSDDGANSHFQGYSAGVAKTTSALTDIRFSCTTGNIDGGTIHLYGYKNA